MKKAEVINGNLNLRKTRRGDVLCVIPNGTVIEVGASLKGWTEAIYAGHTGYVKNNDGQTKFIRFLED